MLKIGTIVLGAEDVPRAAAFWGAALGYVPRDAGGPAQDWTVLAPADGHGPGLALGRSTSPVQEHPRVHRQGGERLSPQVEPFARSVTEQENHKGPALFSLMGTGRGFLHLRRASRTQRGAAGR
ncbi:VOC family protein [Kitasatospora sp. NPDC094015]|uniref:VOC family protein n=1 Tax=Kitasatospora sp. NPDC094015 TaxID=3155205 RepID=UPI00331B22F3